MVIKAFSHIGICVSDLERSLRFYCDGLGFELVRSGGVGKQFDVVMELNDVDMETRFITRDGAQLELLHFKSPAQVGEPTRRPMNQLGFTHMCLHVTDLQAVAKRVEQYGGAVHWETHLALLDRPDRPGSWVYCTDPDGVRVELIERLADREAAATVQAAPASS
jgi:lactoylglutathione lyase